MAYGCKICILNKGIKGSEIASLPQTEEELWDHLEKEHHIPVRREGETVQECVTRFKRQYPGVEPFDLPLGAHEEALFLR